jgi:hypothetical protein
MIVAGTPDCGKLREFGLWRSLVARLLGVQEVPSSNLGSPTKFLNNLQAQGPSEAWPTDLRHKNPRGALYL